MKIGTTKEKTDLKKLLLNNLFHWVFLFSAITILVVSTITVFNMTDTVVNVNSARETLNSTEKFLVGNYKYRIHASVVAAQHLLTASDLDALLIKPGSPESSEDWLKNSEYLAIKDMLVRFADENGLEFVYYYFRIDNYIQPLIDNIQDSFETLTPSSKLFTIEDAQRSAWNNKQAVVADGESFIDSNGLITAYAPIFDSDGEVFALVGVDIKDEQIGILRNQIVFLSERIESLSKRIMQLIIAMITALLFLVSGGIITFLNQRRSAKTLKDALMQAEHASKAKSAFLANMSHEMRTPLNAIIGMTTIGLKADNCTRKEYSLKKIEGASKQLLGVINDVLDYSKIEAGKHELINAAFCFEKMLKKTCDVIAFRTAEKKQTFNVNIDASIPRLLIGDEQHVSQVVMNLLSNAVKFTPENGSVSLIARLAGEEDGRYFVTVEVTDTGIGISEENKARIFCSFEQADNTITKRFGGTGLGLAISKSIVESMGGTMVFESEKGKGSTFRFVAPFLPGAEIEQETAKTSGKEISKNSGQETKKVSEQETIMNPEQEMKRNAVQETKINPEQETRKNSGKEANKTSERELGDNSVQSTTLALPVSDAAETPEDVTGADDFSGRRLLLVDDIDINREIIIILLEPTGIDIDCAENGAVAVEMFKKNPESYDIIFMDVQMPEMDGYQAAQTIRLMVDTKAKTIPIIAMTANVFKEDIEQSAFAGMNDHLGKPLDIDEVLNMLRYYLARGD